MSENCAANGTISIIIVSYNQFETTTGPCLESLSRCEVYEAMEIIVVDNNSSDGTPDKLRKIAEKDQNIRLVLNKTNRGFAGGTNDGVRVATGDIVVLLNSDTLVPPAAMIRMSEKFQNNPRWDMVGPMTNEAGNEQRIFTSARDPEGIVREGGIWCSHARNCFFETDSLVFYCVAMRRDFFEGLGGLDEGYGLGFYEDTDFCIRALARGGKLVIAEDIFVYHQGSASFSKDPQQTRRLLRKNEKIFKKKNPSAPRIKHVREKLLDVMGNYVSMLEGPCEKEDIRYLFNNRMQLAQQMAPNNFFKRFGYLRRIKAVERKFKEGLKL